MVSPCYNLPMGVGDVLGAIGAAAGVGALVYAHIAYRASKASGHQAEEANILAKGSNTIALGAYKLAIDANAYSRRDEERAVERHDVTWAGDWVQPGVYRITKRGDDEARDVRVAITVDGEEAVSSAELVEEAGYGFDLPFRAAARRQEAYRREWEDARREAARRRAAYPAMSGGMSAPLLRMHDIVEHIQWTTTQGVPKTHQEKKRYAVPTFNDD